MTTHTPYHFQNTDIPSGFQNSKWEFTKWSWDDNHLPEELHGNRSSLEEFLGWLTRKASALSKQKKKALNKNQLQQLLLGIGLYLRDIEITCFTDLEEESFPDYLVGSKIIAGDSDSLKRILELLSDVVNQGSRYVLFKNDQENTNRIQSDELDVQPPPKKQTKKGAQNSPKKV